MEDSKQYDDIIDVMMMMMMIMTSTTTVGIVKVIGECDCNSLTHSQPLASFEALLQPGWCRGRMPTHSGLRVRAQERHALN